MMDYKALYENAMQQVREALEILGAGEKESLADAARRRMYQAMPARKMTTDVRQTLRSLADGTRTI